MLRRPNIPAAIIGALFTLALCVGCETTSTHQDDDSPSTLGPSQDVQRGGGEPTEVPVDHDADGIPDAVQPAGPHSR